MKNILAVVILLIAFGAKAETLEKNSQWDKASFYNGIVILERSKPELRFTIFDPATLKFYPVIPLVQNQKSKITGVDIFRDQPFLSVDVQFPEDNFWKGSGVMDYKGNWIIRPDSFSAREVVPGFVIGYSRTGSMEIRNFQNEIVKSFSVESRCNQKLIQSGFIIHCKNPSRIIRFDLTNTVNMVSEFEHPGEYQGFDEKANLFTLNDQHKTILFSEAKGKLYEFPDFVGINFLNATFFNTYNNRTGVNEGYYQVEKGKLDLKTGTVHAIEAFGSRCLEWRATFDGVESTRILDHQANWHDTSEDLTPVCNLKSPINETKKDATLELRRVVTEKNTCGYQNEKNEWQIQPVFSYCGDFIGQVGQIVFEGVKGVINRQGEWLTAEPAKRSFIVKEWDARNPNEVKAGVIDEQGGWVIPPILKENDAIMVENGIVSCSFKTVSGCYRLDFSGAIETITSQEVDQIKQKLHKKELPLLVEEKIRPVAIDGNWGYQTTLGEWLIAPKYAQAEHFSNGVATVALRDEMENLVWGLVDEQGKEIVEPKYHEIQTFYQNMSWFKYNEKWGLLNRDGIEVTEAHFVEVKPIKSDLAIARTDNELTSFPNSRVLINSKGNVIQPDDEITDYIDPFQHGARYARALSDKYWGYIDREGKWLAPPTFESASSFVDGYAVVSLREYDYQRGERKIIWQAPDEEKSTYIISRIEQLGDHPVLIVTMLQGTEEVVSLFDAANGKWIAAE